MDSICAIARAACTGAECGAGGSRHPAYFADPRGV